MYSWLVQWTDEIPTNAPYGEDITFSEDFDAIRLEVDKATSIHAEAPTDWGKVLEDCSSMLSATSKDLWLFWYGCRAAFETHGPAGLAAALEVCVNYFSDHWQGIYPSPAKATRRAAPFLWFIAQMEGVLTREFLHGLPENECQDLRHSFEAMQSLIDKELDDQAPSFRLFIRALPDPPPVPTGGDKPKGTKLKQANSANALKGEKSPNSAAGRDSATAIPENSSSGGEQPLKEDSTTPHTGTWSSCQSSDSPTRRESNGAGVNTAALTTRQVSLGNEADTFPAAKTAEMNTLSSVQVFPQSVPTMSEASLTQLIRAASEHTRQLASYFLATNPTDWKAYALNRAALWGSIIQLPEASSEGITQIRPPAKDRLQEYASALMNNHYAAILQALEKTASHAPFWLDGHAMVIKCLKALHAPKSAEVLTVCLQCFLDKFPQLLKYQFFDGTPFASQETLSLLNSLDTPRKSGPPASIHLPQEGEAKDIGLIAEALDVMKAKGFHEAFRCFDTLALSKSRQGLINALTKINFCLVAGRPEAALTLATVTYKQLEDWGMVEWEPELSARLLGLIIKSPEIPPQKRDELYQKLHWLHMETALALMPD